MKRKVGRPIKYTPAKIEKIARELLSYAEQKREEGKPIFLSGFCVEKKVSRSTLSAFQDKTSKLFKPELVKALKDFKDFQEFDLAEGALTNRYQSTFSIFAMKNVCGWRDEQYIKGEGFNNIFNIIIPKDYKSKNPNNRILSELPENKAIC